MIHGLVSEFARAQVNHGPTREALAGTVERVTFHNGDSGFAVLRVKVRGHRDLVTVIGHAPTISEGEFFNASGTWTTDRNHGLQFKADTLKTTPPTGAAGIERYLGSGQMRGIGPAMAKRIVAAFGDVTFEVIEAEPARLDRGGGHRSLASRTHRSRMGRAKGRPRNHDLPSRS